MKEGKQPAKQTAKPKAQERATVPAPVVATDVVAPKKGGRKPKLEGAAVVAAVACSANYVKHSIK